MSGKINWGILSTGAIAKCFATNLAKSQTGHLLAVGSRSQESADKFAQQFSIPKAYPTYEALLADKEVEAVYIAPPHPLHARWAIAAIRAGKHVLLEKPFALNSAEAMAVFEEASLHNVLVMEAFMYRCHPQTHKLIELLRSKAIGDVRVINSTFAFQAGFNADSRIFNNDLAGGGIMDVGCYTVSMARLIAGVAQGKDFAEPAQVTGAGHVGQTGVDEWAVGTLKFPVKGGSDIVAQIATGVAINLENSVKIFGSDGHIVISNPWVCNRKDAEIGKIIVHRRGHQVEEITIPCDVTSFTIEADVFGNAVLAGKTQAPAPAMTWEDTMSNMRTLERWRQAVGAVFTQETPKGYPNVTVSGSPLAVKSNVMKYTQIPHLDKKVSRLVMGVDNQVFFPHAAIMFDDFFEKGGNMFDTAYVYGGGTQERLLGEWLKKRGVRDQCAVIVKGCHTPACDPISLTWQLQESLRRLQIDCADVYMMHRDNPEIPVGEFIDVLNSHVKAGRIKAFGGSNWTLPRVQQANDYAKSKGLQGFSVVSNNFSLARMVDPIWGGCVAASDADSRAWLTKNQLHLLSWSSQARGFFLPGRAAPDKTDDAELVRCWYSEDNFKRLERAKELANKKGVTPINIALAYVLSQSFPTIALIGPRLLNETRTSMPGLTVALSPDEVRWLNLEI